MLRRGEYRAPTMRYRILVDKPDMEWPEDHLAWIVYSTDDLSKAADEMGNWDVLHTGYYVPPRNTTPFVQIMEATDAARVFVPESAGLVLGQFWTSSRA